MHGCNIESDRASDCPAMELSGSPTWRQASHLWRLLHRFSRFVGLIAALSVASSLVSVGHAAIPAAERAVLQALYTSTNGAGWTTSTNWNGAAGTECTWFGVSCNAGDGNVTRIQLGGCPRMQYYEI